jgi:hypothetical protein
MLANTNWFSPATGQPSVLPSQDMVLGFYYLTIENPISNKKNKKTNLPMGQVFGSKNEQERIPAKFGSLARSRAEHVRERSSRTRNQEPSLSNQTKFPVFLSLIDVLQEYESGSVSLHSQVWVNMEKSNQESFSQIGGSFNTTSPPYRKKNSSDGIQTSRHNAFSLSNLSSLKKSGKENDKNETSFPSTKTGGYSDASGRPGKNPDEPLFLRISNSARTTKVFSSYKWSEDSKEKRTGFWIRTTPGRILVNQLILSA